MFKTLYFHAANNGKNKMLNVFIENEIYIFNNLTDA